MIGGKEYKHVVWDWNGTLVNDVEFCVDILNGILRDLSLSQITVELYREKFSFPVYDFYVALGWDRTGMSFEEISNAFVNAYWSDWKKCDLHSNVSFLITGLHNKGLTQSILSASKQEPLEGFVRHYDLEVYLNDCIGIKDQYAHGKIDEGKAWIEKSEFKEDEILMIGDTVHDFEVAQEMGIDCVLIADGHNSVERLNTCGVPVFQSLEELEILVK